MKNSPKDRGYEALLFFPPQRCDILSPDEKKTSRSLPLCYGGEAFALIIDL